MLDTTSFWYGRRVEKPKYLWNNEEETKKKLIQEIPNENDKKKYLESSLHSELLE
jgi:hypothetical protein